MTTYQGYRPAPMPLWRSCAQIPRAFGADADGAIAQDCFDYAARAFRDEFAPTSDDQPAEWQAVWARRLFVKALNARLIHDVEAAWRGMANAQRDALRRFIAHRLSAKAGGVSWLDPLQWDLGDLAARFESSLAPVAALGYVVGYMTAQEEGMERAGRRAVDACRILLEGDADASEDGPESSAVAPRC